MILVTKSSIPDFKEYCEEISDIWESHWLTNMGEKHQKLQKNLQEYFSVNHVTLFTNGHLALENVLEAYNFPKGSQVITTPFTFASTTHSIVREGLQPVFCDINDKDYTMDVNKIEELINEKTVAIMPVHVYGNMCDVEEIDKIAKKHNLKVIYDAAHTFGVKYKGKSSANYGDVSIFSFHATKVFNTVEGGCATYQDDSLVQKLNDLKNFGIRNEECVMYVGGNAKMSEFHAAMGLCNLRHIDEWINSRKKVVDRYNERLNNKEGIILCMIQDNVEPNYAYYPVVFDNYKYSRDEVFEKLKKEDIIARKYFYPLTNEFDCYKGMPGFDSDQTPVAKRIASEVLTLPLYVDLALEDVDRICDIILN